METEKQSEPDSTTLEKDMRQQFRKDEDVLCLNSKDGCFYLGTIVQVDNIYKKCLVEFLDNTKMWSSFKDLKSFAPQEPEICFVCKKSQLKDENNIIICKCGRECQQDSHEVINGNYVWQIKVNSSTEYYGRGLVKRSTPFPVSEQANNVDTRFRSHAVRKARRLLNKNLKRKKKTAQTSIIRSTVNYEFQEKKNTRISHKNFPQTFEEFVQLRKRKMNLHTRQSNPEIKKRPQRNLLEARLNSTESKLYNPFNSVDNSESKKSKTVVHDNNKKQENSSSKKSKSIKAKSCEKQNKTNAKPNLVQKTIYDSFNLKSTEKQKYEIVTLVPKCKVKESDQTSGDSKSNSVKSGRGRRSIRSESLDRTPVESDPVVTSSDDEASSSRGTLEPFIPTPKDFEGQNNPFRSVNDLMSFPSAIVPPSNPPITLPLPLKTVIPHSDPPRLKKRQLSEEDIIIDRNGQVKRRRRHRKMGPGTTAAKSAQITPGKSKQKHWTLRNNEKKTLQPLVNNGGDFALNGRQLRARDSMKMEKQTPPAKASPLKQSPAKEGGGPLAEDLESSVKYFFGAASRILNGEKYEIRAKRITFDGRLQCIIDWKGLPT